MTDEEQIDGNAKIPKEINEIVTKAMSVDKLKRFTSMEEFRGKLLPYIDQPATGNGKN